MTPEEKIGAILKSRGLTIALAESCTGGIIAGRITDVPGASDYFSAGVVSYSNSAKEEILHVSGDLIRAQGAVSSEVALEMARGVRQTGRVDIGLSVTGIAGPSGGSPEKPVGTVFIALATGGKAVVRECHFMGDRQAIRAQTADGALALLLEYLEKG